MADEGRVPDFYVVGHGKSGTTAMYEMLSQHPQIFVGLKEPRFFVEEMGDRDIPRAGGTPKTLDEYRAWYRGAAPDQFVVDVSPWYLWSKTAAARIAQVRPDARIVAILREPASFLRSLHLQWLQLYVESEADFRKAIELEEQRRQGKKIPVNTYWPNALLYSEHVQYAEQLRRYHAVFPPEQVLVLIYDEFRADNEGTMRGMLRFLGVDDTIAISQRESNPSVGVQAPRANSAVRAVMVAQNPALRALKRTAMALTPGGPRRRALYAARRRFVWSEPSKPDEQFMTELRRRFKPEVEAIGDYLGRDLVSLWGYDRLD